MKISNIFPLIIIAFLYGCTTNTIDDLEPVGQDVPDLVTYQDVRATFDNICSVCHNDPPQNGAPMPLLTYENVKEAVLNRGLLERISRSENDPGLMPFGGPRLPQETIDLIKQWNTDGLLEN